MKRPRSSGVTLPSALGAPIELGQILGLGIDARTTLGPGLALVRDHAFDGKGGFAPVADGPGYRASVATRAATGEDARMVLAPSYPILQ